MKSKNILSWVAVMTVFVSADVVAAVSYPYKSLGSFTLALPSNGSAGSDGCSPTVITKTHNEDPNNILEGCVSIETTNYTRDGDNCVAGATTKRQVCDGARGESAPCPQDYEYGSSEIEGTGTAKDGCWELKIYSQTRNAQNQCVHSSLVDTKYVSCRGQQGAAGTGLNLLGSFSSCADYQSGQASSAAAGDFYLVDGKMCIYTNTWPSCNDCKAFGIEMNVSAKGEYTLPTQDTPGKLTVKMNVNGTGHTVYENQEDKCGDVIPAPSGAKDYNNNTASGAVRKCTVQWHPGETELSNDSGTVPSAGTIYYISVSGGTCGLRKTDNNSYVAPDGEIAGGCKTNASGTMGTPCFKVVGGVLDGYTNSCASDAKAQIGTKKDDSCGNGIYTYSASGTVYTVYQCTYPSEASPTYTGTYYLQEAAKQEEVTEEYVAPDGCSETGNDRVCVKPGYIAKKSGDTVLGTDSDVCGPNITRGSTTVNNTTVRNESAELRQKCTVSCGGTGQPTCPSGWSSNGTYYMGNSTQVQCIVETSKYTGPSGETSSGSGIFTSVGKTTITQTDNCDSNVSPTQKYVEDKCELTRMAMGKAAANNSTYDWYTCTKGSDGSTTYTLRKLVSDEDATQRGSIFGTATSAATSELASRVGGVESSLSSKVDASTLFETGTTIFKDTLLSNNNVVTMTDGKINANVLPPTVITTGNLASNNIVTTNSLGTAIEEGIRDEMEGGVLADVLTSSNIGTELNNRGVVSLTLDDLGCNAGEKCSTTANAVLQAIATKIGDVEIQ